MTAPPKSTGYCLYLILVHSEQSHIFYMDLPYTSCRLGENLAYTVMYVFIKI